jgi:glycosyltransferase involved in cell wall biosynthesis
MKWPRISLVTPSLNQGRFLERTIASVLEQDYPNLQYGVVDGGSTDGSIEIIERHRDRLDFVVIEPDHGQSDAINKGLRRADGHILGWLNSDDTLLPDALLSVGRHFHDRPQSDWLVGGCCRIDDKGDVLGLMLPEGRFTLAGALLRREKFDIPQPATFWRRWLTDRVGLIDSTLDYCMDFDLWCRFLAVGVKPTVIGDVLATYRLHDESKSCSQPAGFLEALIQIEKRYARLLPLKQRVRLWRMIGYQRRACAIQSSEGRPWNHVWAKPWWLGSQQVRQALFSRRRAA